MLTPKGESAGAPDSSSSSVRMKREETSRPGPPYSTGQFGAAQPFTPRTRCHSMISAWLKLPSTSALARMCGGCASRMNARTSSRKRRCSGRNERSMGPGA